MAIGARTISTRLTLVTTVLLVVGLFVAVPAGAQGAARPSSSSSGGPSACGAGTGASGGIAAGGSIRATRAEVTAIEQTIANEELCITDLSEQYDQATYRLQQIDLALSATKVKLAAAQRGVSATRSQLQSAALAAYMYDEPAVELGSMFSGTTNTSSLQNAYVSDVLGNISGDLDALRAAQQRLLATQHLLLSERAKAASDAAAAQRTEVQAAAETRASEATLSKVKGRLAAQVAAAAALKAEQDAAEVAASASARIKQQDALAGRAGSPGGTVARPRSIGNLCRQQGSGRRWRSHGVTASSPDRRWAGRDRPQSSRELPRRPLRMGRFEPFGSRLLGPDDARLASSRGIARPLGRAAVTGEQSGAAQSPRARGPAVLRLRRQDSGSIT